jgi:hypothetical protein
MSIWSTRRCNSLSKPSTFFFKAITRSVFIYSPKGRLKYRKGQGSNISIKILSPNKQKKMNSSKIEPSNSALSLSNKRNLILDRLQTTKNYLSFKSNFQVAIRYWSSIANQAMSGLNRLWVSWRRIFKRVSW